eukprot:scaffold25994_cov40-Attheya_sp.AAC.3
MERTSRLISQSFSRIGIGSKTTGTRVRDRSVSIDIIVSRLCGMGSIIGWVSSGETTENDPILRCKVRVSGEATVLQVANVTSRSHVWGRYKVSVTDQIQNALPTVDLLTKVGTFG